MTGDDLDCLEVPESAELIQIIENPTLDFGITDTFRDDIAAEKETSYNESEIICLEASGSEEQILLKEILSSDQNWCQKIV